MRKKQDNNHGSAEALLEKYLSAEVEFVESDGGDPDIDQANAQVMDDAWNAFVASAGGEQAANRMYYRHGP